jgi:catechol 2,3-dioxygenase-like lactoylglutathione lyase family enzyme
MIKTFGLTHIALAVKDARRSFDFYRKVFGVVKVYDDGGFIQAQTPGSRDVLVFDENPPSPGYGGRKDSRQRRVLSQRTLSLLRRSGRLRGGDLVRASDES